MDQKVFETLFALGYPCTTNGEIPTYEETFNICKDAVKHAVLEIIDECCNREELKRRISEL